MGASASIAQDDDLVVIGQVGALYGVKGWVKLYSFTDPMENLLNYRQCFIRSKSGWKEAVIDTGRRHGKGLIAHVVGYDDRDSASELAKCEIAIARSRLPSLAADEFYWHQLIGLTVSTSEEFGAVLLGKVDHLIETGANDVLVIRPCEGSIDANEHLVPYIPDQYVFDIDLQKQTMQVRWDPEF
jgi:16S rRNA processing protein RimM